MEKTILLMIKVPLCIMTIDNIQQIADAVQKDSITGVNSGSDVCFDLQW